LLLNKLQKACSLTLSPEMSLAKNYNPTSVEDKWYTHWDDQKYFHSSPDQRPAYTIVMPPPNVTGVLHMGHALNNTVQDILIRRARLKGFNTCWVPGTDHASIATEAKVAAMLQEQGIDKNSLSREEFLEHAMQWKEKYGGIILTQLRKMGCALDWSRVNFTMDPEYYEAVIDVFIDLHEKGLVYRGVKMINWDPQAKTALSDEEVNHKEVQSKLVYVNYPLVEDLSKHISIATVRPETILGDTAVCVHPDDARYKDLIGKKCLVPLINREVPIIADDYIDIEFGTGCLKVTPAHDINDFNISQKHNLEVIDTLNEDGTMSEAAQLYIGQDRFKVRKQIVVDLEAKGYLQKAEDYTHQVGFSERTNAVVEPRLSMQWWCDMEKMALPALEVVESNEVEFVPAKFKNTYRHWMGNIRDWCISRQLWWGQRIPAWYNTNGKCQVAKTKEEAIQKFEAAGQESKDLRQDDDVLDTWFSSWLWPLQVFGWNELKEGNAELDYYYPTNTLVTAPEIIFFWVARMIMSGLEYKKQIPFKQVYFTGIVRDKKGRKMSKSLGNSPDLLKMIDDYGADAVRFGVTITSPAGNDLLFDMSTVEQGKNFTNKIWNALKLLKIFETKVGESGNESAFANEWFHNRLQEVKSQVASDLERFSLSEALKKIYSLIWSDYCSWYLEFIKPSQDANMSQNQLQQAQNFLNELMKLLHPFMPFITEEIYHLVSEKDHDLVNSELADAEEPNKSVIDQGALLKEIITAVRDVRAKNGIKNKDIIQLHVPTDKLELLNPIKNLLCQQSNADALEGVSEPPDGSISLVVGDLKVWLSSDVEVDQSKMLEDLEKDLAYNQKFLISVERKLSNEKFIQNAKPEVVELERKKKADAEEKIKVLEESIRNL